MGGSVFLDPENFTEIEMCDHEEYYYCMLQMISPHTPTFPFKYLYLYLYLELAHIYLYSCIYCTDL